jgi:hypothetical protein
VIIYLVAAEDVTEGEVAFTSLHDAIARAREEGTRVRKIVLPKLTRALVCAIFNREGFAEKQEDVWIAKRRGN